MKVLLINVDAKFNLAIRKLYRYYKEAGAEVQMVDLNFPGYPHKKSKAIDAQEFDSVWISNLFEVNAGRVLAFGCKEIHYGGIGSIAPEAKLPAEVEILQPWYSEDETMSYGFVTRGCIRNCWFCKVPKHEGKLFEYNRIEDIVQPGHKEVCLLDNNILAYEKHERVLTYLAEHKLRCDLNQGLDFRKVTDSNATLLSRIRYIGAYTFAFDDPKYKSAVNNALCILKKHIPQDWRIAWYIYFHPKMSVHGFIDRVLWCKENKCLPYVMRDKDCYTSELADFCTDMASWCNQRGLLKKLTFEEFLYKRHTNEKRIAKSLETYERGLRNEC